MVVIDSTMLLLLFRPNTPVPSDIKAAPERVAFLVEKLGKERSTLIIPTPVLSEALIRAGGSAATAIVEEVTHHHVFRVEPFDSKAAIELAEIARAELSLPKAKKDHAATHAKLRFDQQVLAIAKANGATLIYSDDENLRTVAARHGVEVKGLRDLELPPEKHQTEMFNGVIESTDD